MAKILIVDDEPRIRELIREHLEHEGFQCEEATDGSAALAALAASGADLVILDIMMPFVDGMTCLREMRKRKIDTPVIMLTARGEEYDKLAGLEGGADDYVVKPFSPRELVARVKVVLARTMPKTQEGGESFVFGDLVIDTASHSVKIAWPPSSPGMGRMFMMARMIEMKAHFDQKSCQFHAEGKMLPMEMNPPSSSYILVLGCTIIFNCSQ